MKVLIEKEKYDRLWVDLHNAIIDIKDKITQEEYDTLMDYANLTAQLADDINHPQLIDYDKLDELAHNHCMNIGYSAIDDNDYINDETLTWGDIMKDIKRAYKSGYRKAKEE